MDDSRHDRGLAAYAAFTAVVTLALILAGGFVTTTATGDTIPSWPLSWGRLVPPSWAGGVWVEWGHRAVAGTVGLLVSALFVWTLLARSGLAARRLALLALIGVLVQSGLGGLRIFAPDVSQGLRAGVAIVHACFGQLVFGAVVATAVALSRAWREAARDEAAHAARKLGIVTTAFAFAQLVAGAVTRHTGAGIIVHVTGAFLVILHVALLGSKVAGTGLRRGGALAMLLVCAQMVLGLASWTITSGDFARSHQAPVASIVTVTAHVAVGAGILATSLAMTLLAFRAGRAVPEAQAEPAMAAEVRA